MQVKDMATRMLTIPDPVTNKLLPDPVVSSNTSTFLVAGHDSTSTAITMLLYHVASHPEVEEKVFEEASRVVGDEPLTWDMLGKLVYCTQVVKENLRLFPPAPQFVKNSPPERETTLGKYRIPPGSSLLISTFALHYNPSVYADPYAFNPDRWEAEEAAKRSPCAWCPFSYGKRACIGMQLSLIEQRVALVKLVRKYFLRVDPSTKITITMPLFMNPQGIHLRFIPRSASPPPPLAARFVKANLASDSAPLGKCELLSSRRLLALYGSNMSTCEGFATRLVNQGSELGLTCSKAPLNALCSATPPEVPPCDQILVLVVTSTYNGLPPENAKDFADWLPSDGAGTALKNVALSVFGAGNRQWAATYQRFGRSIDERFKDLGARALLKWVKVTWTAERVCLSLSRSRSRVLSTWLALELLHSRDHALNPRHSLSSQLSLSSCVLLCPVLFLPCSSMCPCPFFASFGLPCSFIISLSLYADSRSLCCPFRGEMDGGQIEVEFARWTLAWTVGLFQSERIPMATNLGKKCTEGRKMHCEEL